MENSAIKQKRRILSFFILVFAFLGNFVSLAQAGIGINTNDPKSTLEVNGSMSQKVVSITLDTTLSATDNTVVCKNTTAITIILPAASNCEGRVYTIKKDMNSTNDVTIDGAGSETIDGAATYVLSDVLGSLTIASNGTEWKIISDHLSSYPMGEVSYFYSIDGTGKNVSIPYQYIESPGILPSTNGGYEYMVPCNPTTQFAGMTMDFDNGGFSNNGTLRYIGRTPRLCHIACTISVSPATSNDEFIFGVAKNSTVVASSKIIQRMGATSDAQSTAIHVVILLNHNDVVNFYVGNLIAGRNVIVKSLNLFALGM
ncbi:MAG: hypothetical protein K2X95_03700 [Flavobacteriaceae bacterium]|nr:hypothetical protein [Flavobacteriaceae bacterium]